jgi:hypothetical protein
MTMELLGLRYDVVLWILSKYYYHTEEDQKVWNVADCKKIDDEYLNDKELFNKFNGTLHDCGIPLLSDLVEIITSYVVYPDYFLKESCDVPNTVNCKSCKLPMVQLYKHQDI